MELFPAVNKQFDDARANAEEQTTLRPMAEDPIWEAVRVMKMTPEQKAKHYGVPLIEPPEPSQPAVDPNPVVAVCWCGEILRRADTDRHKH